MPTVPISSQILPAIQPQQFAQNGRIVSPQLEYMMRQEANQVARFRTKELARFGGQNIAILAAKGTYARWRSACHTGPFCDKIGYRYLCARDTSGTDASVTVAIYTIAGALVSSAVSYPGGPQGVATDVPSEWTEGEGEIDISADTDYEIRVSESDGRLISMIVYEKSFSPTVANGYFTQSVGATSPIYDVQREELMVMATNFWKRGAAHIANWTADDQTAPISTVSATDTNLWDGSTGAVSASTPGLTLDMRYKASLAGKAGCPVTLWFYASSAAGTGTVKVKDSSGAALLTVSVTGAVGWYSVTGFLPATKAKYDIQYAASSTSPFTLQLYAISLLEYLT
jgi:hypothetical protein